MFGPGPKAGAELTSLFPALVGTFPPITTVLTDKALEARQILTRHQTKELQQADTH